MMLQDLSDSNTFLPAHEVVLRMTWKYISTGLTKAALPFIPPSIPSSGSAHPELSGMIFTKLTTSWRLTVRTIHDGRHDFIREYAAYKH